VSLAAFRHYFGSDGPAWPYERQALVKLRPIAGDDGFGGQLASLRDELVYSGSGFDFAAMRAMRERQVRQRVRAGTFHAKLSPGGLVDLEYLTQALQVQHGRRHPEIREPNTLRAMASLERVGVIVADAHAAFVAAYTFSRRLIDALRMVRGDARDLTVPATDSEEFEFLARRLGYGSDVTGLQHDLETHVGQTMDLVRRYAEPTGSSPVLARWPEELPE
jgi:glutamate-ammonia-ligase adenylyltransferase